MACYELEPQLYIVKDECLKKASEPKALSKWSIEALKSKHCLSDSEFGCFSFVPNIYSFCFKPRFLFLFINEKENRNHGVCQSTFSYISTGESNFSTFAAAALSSGAMSGLGSVPGFEEFSKTLGGSMAVGFTMGGLGSLATGGDFWSGAATGVLVAVANHYMHQSGVPKKPKGHDFTKRLTKGTATLRQGTRDITPGKPYDSRAFFDRMETFGSYTEATGLAYGIVTGGTSFTLSVTGAFVGAIGTVGNAYMDYQEGNKISAGYRITKFIATAGLGSLIKTASYESATTEFILKASVEANVRAQEYNYNKSKH